MEVRLVFFSQLIKLKYMSTNKKQIKKELKKTLKSVSNLKKRDVKNHQETLENLYNKLNGIKTVVNVILAGESLESTKVVSEILLEQGVEKDLETV